MDDLNVGDTIKCLGVLSHNSHCWTVGKNYKIINRTNTKSIGWQGDSLRFRVVDDNGRSKWVIIGVRILNKTRDAVAYVRQKNMKWTIGDSCYALDRQKYLRKD